MILPFAPASPARPACGTAAIRGGGPGDGEIDFDALLAQAGRLGSGIAALLGGAVATAPTTTPPPPGSGAAPTGTARVGAGEGAWPGTMGANSPQGDGAAATPLVAPSATLMGATTPEATTAAAAGTADPGAALPGTALPGTALPGTALPGTAAPAGAGTETVPDLAPRPAAPGAQPAQEGRPVPTLSGMPTVTVGDPLGQRGGDMAHRPAAPATPAPSAVPGGPAEGLPGVGPEPGAPASGNPSDLAMTASPTRPAPPHPPAAAPGSDRAGANADADAAGVGTSSVPSGVNAANGAHIGATAGGDTAVTAPAVPARIAEIARRRSGATEQIVVRLDPPELGSVRISLTVRGDQVHVVVRAETPEARAALDAQRDQVENLLRGEGFGLGSFDVDHRRRERDDIPSRRPTPQANFDATTPEAPAPAADGVLRL